MSTIGIDLGGTKVQGVVLDHGEVVAEAKASTPTTGVQDVVAALADCIEELGGAGSADAIGIGGPGVVDIDRGELSRAPNLAGFDVAVPLVSLVADATGAKRVVLDNDVNVATLAEHHLGAGKGVDDLLCVFVGTGVGGGLVLGGHVRRGVAGAAGEIGHIVVRDGGRQCGCGLAGHVEAYAGRAAIEREARRRHAAGEETALIELAGDGRLRAGLLAKALAAGDAMAMELLDEAVEALGAGIAAAVTLLDLPLVVVGGGVADKLGPQFVGRIEEAVRTRLFAPASPVRLVPTELGDRAGAVGAALLAAG